MPTVKITKDQALEIRRIYETGAGVTTLASRFGVATSTISRLLRGEHTHTEGMPDITRQAYRGKDWGRFEDWRRAR